MEEGIEGVGSVVDGTKIGVPLDECGFLLSRGLGPKALKTFVKVLFDVSFILSLSPTIVDSEGRLCGSRHSGLWRCKLDISGQVRVRHLYFIISLTSTSIREDVGEF
jgi:hypothetical protein